MEERFNIFTVQVAKISRFVKKIKSEEISKIEKGLKGPHVSCLYYIYKSGATMTAKEISDVCDEDKAAISRSLDFLETKGYISCESKFEKRYKSPLELTEKGFDVAKRVSEKIDNIVDQAGAGFDEEKRKIFYEVLSSISDNLKLICENYGEEE